jgi:simple sugar transport system permease protein
MAAQVPKRGVVPAGLPQGKVAFGVQPHGAVVEVGGTAIVVAWLARLKPWAIGLASIFLAALRVGTENLMLELQVPAAFGHIMEGLILVTVIAGQFFLAYAITVRSREVS